MFTKKENKLYFSLMVIVFATLFCVTAHAAFPDKPVKLLVGQGAGGSTDTVTRTFAQFFSKYLNTPVVVSNMKGAGGRIMLKHMNAQPADGYSLCMVVTPSYINVQLMRNPSWDLNQFTYIQAVAGGDSNGLIVPFDSQINTFADLVETAKKGPITIGATSPGSNSWLLSVLLQQYAGDFKFKYVPFDSGKKATMAIVGGHVTVGIASTINFPRLVKQKKIKVLASASKKRLYYLPEVSTFTELGYPKIVTAAMFYIAGPPKMPQDIKGILAAAAEKAATDPEYLKLAKKQGFSIERLSAAEALNEFKNDYESTRALLKKAGEIK